MRASRLGGADGVSTVGGRRIRFAAALSPQNPLGRHTTRPLGS